MRKVLVLDVLDVIVMNDARRITPVTSRVADVIGEILCRMKRTGRGSFGTTVINGNSNFIEWATEGIEVEVISADANGWLKGKVKLCLEFIPDSEPEPESLLDEFRQLERELLP